MGKRKRSDAPTGELYSKLPSSSKYQNLEEDGAVDHKPRNGVFRGGKQEETYGADDRSLAPPRVLIEDDEREYFSAIKAELISALDTYSGRIYGTSATAVNHTPVENESEDSEDMFYAIWDRIEGKEIVLSKDKELSFILEYLLRLTGSRGLDRLLSTLLEAEQSAPGTIVQLTCHFCSSHILERIFDCAATIPADELTFIKDLRKLVDILAENAVSLFEDPYAMHVLEKMLLKSCFVVDYTAEKSRVAYRLYDQRTAQVVEFLYSGQMSGLALPDSLRAGRRCFDDKIVKKLLGSYEKYLQIGKFDVGESNIVEVASGVNGSVVLQTLLLALNIMLTQSDSKEEDGSLAAYATTLLKTHLLPKLTINFSHLVFSKFGSRLAELLIVCADRPCFAGLVQELTSSPATLEKVISDQFAHHSIIKLIDVCTDMTLISILVNTICSRLDTVIFNGRSMIVVKTAQKLADTALKQSVCGKHGSASEWNQCQAALIEALKDFYVKHGPDGWSDQQKRDNFVVLVGALFPRNFSMNAEDIARGMTMPGSQVLQALCTFKESAAVTGSVTKLSPSVLLELCSNVCGSYFIETLLKTQRGQKNFYGSFVKSLIDLCDQLMLSKAGSRVFDSLWKGVDMKQKETIVEKLIPAENRLRTNEYGRYLLPKLNFNLFRRNRDNWRAQQKHFETQKEDLKAIFELAKSRV